MIVAAVALAVDLVTAGPTGSMSRTSMIIRAAFLHTLADAPGSVGVMVAATAALRSARQGLGIGHTTLELECARHACTGAARIGH